MLRKPGKSVAGNPIPLTGLVLLLVALGLQSAPAAAIASQDELAAAFNASSNNIFTATKAPELEKLKATLQCTVAPVENGLKVTATGIDPNLLLPDFATGKRFVIQVIIDSPVETPIEVYWLVQGAKGYDESHAQIAPLKKGKNTIYFRIDEPNVVDPIRYDPGGAPGDYVIESIIARSLKAVP